MRRRLNRAPKVDVGGENKASQAPGWLSPGSGSSTYLIAANDNLELVSVLARRCRECR